MKFTNPIEKDGLAEEILRICGTTNAVYSNYAMVARINAALDRYWVLASSAAPKGIFDDTNQTALPVETQNLVIGTNAYKVSSFTNKVLQILKLAVLDEDAVEHDLIREDFDDLDDFTELYSTASGDRGEPQYWTKMGDYIYLRPCPDYAESNGLRCYVNRELSKYTWTTFTVTIASPGVFTATAHGLSGLDGLIFETDGALPTGLTADTVVYYLITAGYTADAFQVSASYSLTGTAVNTSGTQSGNHKFLKTNKEPGIPVVHHNYLARAAALPFLIEKKLPQTGAISQMIAQDEAAILDFWQEYLKDYRTVIRPSRRLFK